jgi:uncharacterized protein
LTVAYIAIQLTLLKEHYLFNFANAFQDHGIAALVYDHRGYGSSDGTPRSETDIYQQAEDASDAVTYVASLEEVDPKRIAIWGIGHSGGMSIIAAAIDPRIAAALILMPFTSGSSDRSVFPMDQVWENKASRRTEYIRIWPNTKEEALEDPPQLLLAGEQPWNFIEPAREMTRKARDEEFLNQLSLQSFYHIAKCEPKNYIEKLKGKPLLYLVAEWDALTGPVENHRKVFDQGGNWNGKQWVMLEDHHLKTYIGDTLVENVKVQVEFVQKYV